MVQWLRICHEIQGTLVGALVWEDLTGHRVSEPVHHHF